MSAKLKGIRDVIGSFQDDVDGLRDRIAALQEERERVEMQHVDQTEAERRIEALIEDARGRDMLRPSGLFAADRCIFNRGRFAANLAANPLGVLATLFPEQLRNALAAYAPEGGISEDARQAQLAKIDADLEAAAIAEEVALRDFEEAVGTEVLRRSDADPRLLVAFDAELGR
jgi:hypothetical protein